MFETRSRVALLGITALLGPTARGQTAHPMITHAIPVAVQRGKTTPVVVHGQMNFAGAYKALFEGDGVTATVVPPDTSKGPAPTSASSAALEVTVAPEAELGQREFRIASPLGISTVGQLLVTDLPVIAETAEHATREAAQAIGLGTVVAGVIAKPEEEDVYKISVAAGQIVTFEVHANRFMDKVHDLQAHFDPLLSLEDSEGKELATSDDAYFADPLVSYRFELAGDYFVRVRDVTYAGDGRWNYALTVTDQPYVTAVAPRAVQRTGLTRVRAIGFGVEGREWELSIPKALGLGPHRLSLRSESRVTNPVLVEVTDLPIVPESEPNDVAGAGPPISFPTAIVGVIERAGDEDCFPLALKQGVAVRLEVKARRLDSSLDSQLDLIGADGQTIASGDDFARTKDSLLVHTPSADGIIHLRVRDLLGRGGPTFGYVVEVTRDLPDFDLACDDDKTGIAPGGFTPWFARVTRRGGFAGNVEIRVEGLPNGVSASPLVIEPTISDGCIVLAAAPDAAHDAALVRMVGIGRIANPDGSDTVIERIARPLTEIYMPGGGRATFDVATHAVGVCPVADLTSVRVNPGRAPLAPGHTVTLEVQVERHQGYKGRVTLDPILRHLGGVHANPLPPGVVMVDDQSKTSLGPDESKGTIVLRAEPTAKPIADVPIAIMANVSINFVVKRPYASPPVLVSVLDPTKPDAGTGAGDAAAVSGAGP